MTNPMGITVHVDCSQDEDGFAFEARVVGYRSSDKTTISLLAVSEGVSSVRAGIEKQIRQYFPDTEVFYNYSALASSFDGEREIYDPPSAESGGLPSQLWRD